MMPLRQILAVAGLTITLAGAPLSLQAQHGYYMPPCPQYPPGHAPGQPYFERLKPTAPAQPPAAADQTPDTQPLTPPETTSPEQQAQPQQQAPAPQAAAADFSQALSAPPGFAPTAMAGATSPTANAPNMIGDFFGTSGTTFIQNGASYSGPSTSATGLNVGRMKQGENTSPIPRDRVFMNYSMFTNTPLNSEGVRVNRFTPGFERTLLDGHVSVEVRVPFATTIDTRVPTDGSGTTFYDQDELELGDLTMFLKGLLCESDTCAISAGLGVSIPTSDPFEAVEPSGLLDIRVERNAVHLLPFIGALLTPHDRLYIQGYAQLDYDVNGNTVFFDERLDGGLDGLRVAGEINDPTFLFVDIGVGYWLYRNPPGMCGGGCIRGIAPTVELHWNRSIEDLESVSNSTGNYVVNASPEEKVETLNAVVGANFLLGDNSILTVGWGFPVGGEDDQFDGELRVNLNVLFGRTSQRSFSQF